MREQKWVGIVCEVSGDYFVAALCDKTAGMTEYEEVASILISHVPAEQHTRIQPGASFMWTIFTRGDDPSPEDKSVIDFPEPETWTEEELARIEQRAEALKKTLRW